MKIHHLRNATFVIEAGRHRFLIDPMLSDKGELPPFSFIKYKARRNPTVPLPEKAAKLLEKVTCCMITLTGKKGIGIRNGNLKENLLMCVKPSEEPFYMPLVVGDCYRRQSTLILQVVGKVLHQGGEGFWF